MVKDLFSELNVDLGRLVATIVEAFLDFYVSYSYPYPLAFKWNPSSCCIAMDQPMTILVSLWIKIKNTKWFAIA